MSPERQPKSSTRRANVATPELEQSKTAVLNTPLLLQATGVTANVVWYAVKQCAGQAGINNLAPHDLRRTCPRLCHGCGGELEQIQFLLGHASVQTTERYIGSKQKLQDAVNDRLGISVASDTA
jgi:site-specific recombinase XerD